MKHWCCQFSCSPASSCHNNSENCWSVEGLDEAPWAKSCYSLLQGVMQRGMATNRRIWFMEADRTMRQSPINTAVHCLCMVLHCRAFSVFLLSDFAMMSSLCFHLEIHPQMSSNVASPTPHPHCPVISSLSFPLKAGWCLHRDHRGPYGTAAAMAQREKSLLGS